MSEPVLLVDRRASVAVVTLNRPTAYNALDLDLMRAFAAAMTALATDDDVRAVVITGAGKAFCAGGDLAYVAADPRGSRASLYELAGVLHQGTVAIRRMPKPVIAAINGVAAGGGFSLALGCDLRIMDAGTVLKQAYTSAGLTLDGGGSFALPRLVGHARALEIVALDPKIDATTAKEWGLITAIAQPGEALTDALTLAHKLSHRAIGAIGTVKRLLSSSFDTPYEVQLEREREAIAAASEAEGAEGIAAFVAKRRPVFHKD